MELIRTFNSDLVFIRTQFPMGKVGLTIKDGKISPDGQKLNELLAIWGPSVKPGDRAIISRFDLKGDRMHFEGFDFDQVTEACEVAAADGCLDTR